MTAWLSSADRGRLSEKLTQFAQTIAGPAELSEVLAAGAHTLQELLGADRVALWSLSGGGSCLRWCAGTSGEWLGTELELGLYPRLADLLRIGRPQWIELAGERWPDTPAVLLGAHSFVFLPLSWLGEVPGCALVVFDHRHSAPGERELEESQVVAALLAGAWRDHETRHGEQRYQGKWATLLRVAQALVRAPTDRRALQALVQATNDAVAADGLAIYQLQEQVWHCVAATANRDLFPAQLPAGEPEAWPWEQATATAATVIISSREPAESFPPGVRELCPAWAAQPHEILVLSLPSPGPTSRVLLAALPPTAPRLLGPVLEVWAAFIGLTLAAGELPGSAAQAEARYQQLCESLPVPAFRLDAGGRFTLVNRALLEWTGEPAPVLLQQSLTRFLDDAGRETFAASRAAREPSWRSEVLWPARTGPKLCQLVLRRTEQPDAGWLGFLYDLTTIQRLEQERQWVEARLKGILDSVHDGVWLIGTDRTVQFANYRLGHLFGVDLREIGPGRVHDSIIEQLKGRFREQERVAARWHSLNTRMEEVAWEELELVQPRRRVLERFVRPVHDQNHQLVGRLEVYRDVTAQRHLEHKLIQQEKLAQLGQLVSGVAHELNNPLTTVAGYAQLLQRHKVPEAAREELARLAQEAERASRIVKNLLLFARPTRPERRQVSIQEILEKALALRAYELTVENIAVERHYAANLADIWADPHQLQQVFLNILLNAEQAIRSVRERGTISIRTLRLSNPERMRIEITDDGPGIPPEELPHVFEPFFSTKEANEGTGLGLSLSRTIVREHGGEIYAEGRPAGGATLAVELPAAVAAEPMAAVESQPSSAAPASIRRPPAIILVVDDEPPVAQLIADVLNQQGYGVEMRTDSRKALQDALAQEFDLVICDIKMPGVDGEAFHQGLLERGHPLASRILFTTGDTLARKTNEFLERVRLPCLEKPFLVDELKAVVRNLLVETSAGEVSGFR